MNIEIQKNVPLAPLTSFKIGGPAKFFVEVSSEEEFMAAVEYAQANSLEIFVMAGGSNILVSDEGFSGLVIKLKVKSEKLEVKVQNSPPEADQPLAEKLTLECWAGDNLSSVVNFCRDKTLTGLEWAAGIPGTIGGAVRGNAGAYGSEMKDSIASVKVFEISNKSETQSSKFKIFTNEECKFSYRGSIFKENKNLVVLSCVLELEKGEKAEIEEKMKEIIKKRTAKIPRDPSPGSFFQNPIVTNPEILERFEKDTGSRSRDGKIPAGWFIEEAGLKGKRMGGVMVSEKHANFVINTGSATAQDVIMLASFIKMRIRDGFGIQLKEEVQMVGF